jgi:hypothetical protein
LIFPAVPALVRHFLPAPFTRQAGSDTAKKFEAALEEQVRDQLSTSPGTRMVLAARALLAVTTDDAYSHVPVIDPAKGIFHADCSELIDYLTKQVKPKALAVLPVDAGHLEPRAWNYYSYLKNQPLVNSPAATGDWGRVGKPGELALGDVIAWKNEAYVPMQSSTGHVMLVGELPQPSVENGRLVGFNVDVIDSTSHGHGPGDVRAVGAKTGLGEGTVFFPIDAQGNATGFSWTPAQAPGSEPPRPPSMAFGRILP